MRRILFVISSLHYGGAAKQLTLLAPGLARAGIDCQVCSLGSPTPWAEAIARQGAPVTSLNWRRRLDVRPLLGLRELAGSFRPDVIHACDLAAMRAIVVLGGSIGARRVLRGRMPMQHTWVDRWLAGHADHVCLAPVVETGERRGVSPPWGEHPNWNADSLGASTSLPPTPPRRADAAPLAVAVCVGPLRADKGFHNGIWSLDILRYLYPNLHLVFVGEGPDRPRLEKFTRITGLTDRVHFVGEQESSASWLASADVVWVPSRTACGVNVALEAMALGRPVVASNLPGLAEVIADGETGLLVPPDDRPALARQTRLLLEDPAQARQLGDAGRHRAAQLFSAEKVAQRILDLYGCAA